MPYKLKWNGAAIVAKYEAKAAAAVRVATHAAAAHAAANHPWRDETGAETASIHAEEPRVEPGMVIGRWRADSPAFYLEVGTVHMPAFPFLRPAADATYGHGRLVGLIRESAI